MQYNLLERVIILTPKEDGIVLCKRHCYAGQTAKKIARIKKNEPQWAEKSVSHLQQALNYTRFLNEKESAHMNRHLKEDINYLKDRFHLA